MGPVKFRYRKCDGCGLKFKTFEEIERKHEVRSFERIKRVPLVDPEHITCPCCQGNPRHTSRRHADDKVTHYYQCANCDHRFAVDTDLSDPIGKARAEATKNARVICPKCDAPSTCRSTRRTKTAIVRRYKCKSCGHRFRHDTPHDGKEETPQPVKQGELGHRILP